MPQRYKKNASNTSSVYAQFSNVFKGSSIVVDSLKLRIQLPLVDVYDPRITESIIRVFESTGELVDEDVFKEKAVQFSENGVKTRFAIESLVCGADRTPVEYLTILVSSKLLHRRYFEGIGNHSIRCVYNRLMEYKAVWFSFEDFLNAQCVDIDFKIDLIPTNTAHSIVNTLYSQAKPRKQQKEACSVYRTKTNMGIQFGLRTTKSYKTLPYLKFYEKVRELYTRSEEFFKTYLSGFDLPEEILRAETTIKNKAHLKAIGFVDNTLGYICENMAKIGLVAFENAFNAHISDLRIHHSIRELNGEKKLKVSERILVLLIQTLMESEYTFVEAREEAIERVCKTRNERWILKSKINELMLEYSSKCSASDDLNTLLIAV